MRDYIIQKRGKRYIIATPEGKLIDDARGYGYKTRENAQRAVSYVLRDKSKDAEKADREEKIARWMKGHKKFVDNLVMEEFYRWKEENNERITAKEIREYWNNIGETPDFTAGDFLRLYYGKPKYSKKAKDILRGVL